MAEPFVINADLKEEYGHIKKIKVTSNDTNTFTINILDNGIAADLTNVTTVSLANTRLDKEVVVTEGSITGTNQVTFNLGTNETAVAGRVDAVVQLYDAEGRVSTLAFSYEVKVDPTGSGFIPSINEQTLIQVVLGDGPLILEDAVEAAAYANEQGAYVDSKRELIDTFTGEQTNLQAQLDVLVIDGDSSPESAQARVGSNATVYPTLKARLDAEKNETTALLAEKAPKTDLILKADKTIVDSNFSTLDTKINSQSSGSPKGIYTTVAALQTAFPTGNTNIYLVIGNVKEVSSLTISAVPTTSGNVTITLNGVATTVALDPTIETTTTLVATKIRNTAFPNGIVTGGTASIVTFTASVGGVKTDATYNAGTTGATGAMTTTTQGVDSDGKWYYWNGSSWASGGVYQSTGIADGGITNNKLADDAVDESKASFIETDKFIKLTQSNITGTGYLKPDGTIDTALGYDITDYIPVKANTKYLVNSHRNTVFYDSAKVKLNYFSTATTVNDTETEFTTPNNTAFMRTNILTSAVPLTKYYIKKASYTAKLNAVIKVGNDNFSDDLTIPNANIEGLSPIVKNIYNKNTNAVSQFIQNDGTFVSNTNYSTTGFIPINSDLRYKIPCHRRVVFYNSLQQIVRYTEDATSPNIPYDITPRVGEAFMRVAIPHLYGITDDTFYVNETGEYLLSDKVIISQANLDLSNSNWKNKKWATLGDSITWYDGRPYTYWVGHETEIAIGYQSIVNNKVASFSSILNKGVSGSTMTYDGGTYSGVTYGKTVDYTQYDLVTIAHGTNDFKLNKIIGNQGLIGDTAFDTYSFYGAYRSLVEYILTQNHKIKLILMTPMQRDNDGYDVNTTNTVGHKLIDYVNAIKNIGQMYGLPVFDLYATSGFTKLTLNSFTYDGLHPQNDGYKVMGEKLYNFIEYVA